MPVLGAGSYRSRNLLPLPRKPSHLSWGLPLVPTSPEFLWGLTVVPLSRLLSLPLFRSHGDCEPTLIEISEISLTAQGKNTPSPPVPSLPLRCRLGIALLLLTRGNFLNFLLSHWTAGETQKHIFSSREALLKKT